jgi:cytochrome P450
MRSMPKIRDYRDSHYNPFTALKVLGGEGRIEDIYPELRRLRLQSPVFEGDIKKHFGIQGDITMAKLRHVAILGYSNVNRILLDHETFSNRIYEHNLGVYFGRSITVMDDPEHRRFRFTFQKAFNPKMLAAWDKEIIPRIINELIDGFESRGHAELVSEFSLHFPFNFIHELMALPFEDRATFQKLAFGQMGVQFDPEHGYEAVENLKSYLTDMFEERRAHPIGGDFVSTIVTSRLNGERLPDDVIISFFRQLMSAGGDTTYNGFSTVLAGLLAHPDALECVKRERDLIPWAIEEGLRWNCPVPCVSRTPVCEVELEGITIRPGDHMIVVLASALRDESAFPNPDRFDIDRRARANLAFGYGPHICLGSQLARLEMATAVNALIDRLPKLRPDDRRPSSKISGLTLRGPDVLNVRFD